MGAVKAAADRRPAKVHSGGMRMKLCVAMVQGYLAHKKLLLPRTLQYTYAQGPRAVFGKGQVLMSEVFIMGGMRRKLCVAMVFAPSPTA